jgi:hypothetical protein
VKSRVQQPRIVLCILLALVPWVVSALEVSEGRVLLEIHERTGRFTLSYLSDLGSMRYEPLFVDEDPRTSVLDVSFDNTVFRVGEDSSLTQSVERTPNGARITWEGAILRVAQEFRFVRARSSGVVSGVQVVVIVENLTSSTRDVAIRALFDTDLGESQSAHFSVADGTAISRERSLIPSTAQNHWDSVPDADGALGLRMFVYGPGAEAIERVAFANWKRLNESRWDYSVNESRNFSLLPYSINDSAALLYGQKVPVAPSQSHEYSFVLTSTTAGALDLSGGTSDTSGTTSAALANAFETASTEANSPEESVRNDLLAVTGLIEEINAALDSPEGMNQEQLEVIREVLRRLRTRAEQYR